MEEKGLHYAMKTIRAMVDNFINDFGHQRQWEHINEEYKKGHNGISKGRESLSLQSYIGSDLLIDFIYLARDVEEGPFTNEYWIRSMGTQCIRNEKDRENNRCFSDILAKISVTYNGTEFTDIHWIQDDDCLIDNVFVKENKLYNYLY